MPLNCGIVGLPNVGKSTLFSALTSAPAEAANYPFCTIDPNKGIVQVPDQRLAQLSSFITTEKVIPAIVEFVDIAGLVRGASKGEGLGNKFLAHIREVGAIAHVVRCFENSDIIHVDETVDPARDIETIHIELALADMESVDKRIQKLGKDRKSIKDQGKLQAQMDFLATASAHLSEGKPIRSLEMDEDQQALIGELQLITAKPMIYVCNVDEEALASGNDHTAVVEKLAAEEGAAVIRVCAQLEKDIAEIEEEEERAIFLEEAGLSESGLDLLIREGYRVLGLRTYFTAGPKEIRAWTFHDGDKAPQAAGVIHTDFEKGFIRAETYAFDDLVELGSEQKVKEAGKLRQEGKEYLVKDGDVMHFKFNV